MKEKICLILVLMISWPPAVGFGQDQPSSIESLIQEALENNPALKAAQQNYEAFKLKIPQSSALPNPTAGYSFMGPNDLMTANGPQNEIYEFEQMVPFPGKLVAKHNMSKAEAQMAQARLRAARRDLIYKVRQTYYDLYAADMSLKITEEVKELLNKFESISESRYASQATGQRDVAKAQSEVSDVLQNIFMLRQKKDSLIAMLNALLNREVGNRLGVWEEPVVPRLNIPIDAIIQKADISSPNLQEARAANDRENRGYSLAKLENTPDFSIGFQYTRIGAGETTSPDDGKDAWMIPVKITLPIWQNRIGPTVAEAKKNVQASENNLKNTENETTFELKNAYYEFQSQRQIFELYKNALIPQAELAFKSDQAGYEAGKVDILNLLDSERVYLNARISYYRALADALKNYYMIEKIIGQDLERGGINNEKHQ